MLQQTSNGDGPHTSVHMWSYYVYIPISILSDFQEKKKKGKDFLKPLTTFGKISINFFE